jgi:membrane-bound lytic murein transglycosylase B
MLTAPLAPLAPRPPSADSLTAQATPCATALGALHPPRVLVATLALGLAGALSTLTGCASGTSGPDATAPLATPTALAAASSATEVSDTTEPGLSGQAQSAPVQSDLSATLRPLPGNPTPDTYANREDARQLAASIAQTMQLDPQWAWDAIAKAHVKESAARLMMPAPAGTAKNWGVYRSRFVEPIRIRAGAAFWRNHESELKRAQTIYGVPAGIIAGVIGVETIYGRNTGNFRVLDVLATLSLDFPKGRSDRSAFFREELAQYLKLCQEQQWAPETVLGSYAGAVGLPQFMPSSIRRYAVDFDGDGHIDLLRSPVDAIGSVAHYLAEHGWQAQWPSYFDVTPPQDEQARAKLLAPDILPSFSAAEMIALGATLAQEGQKHPGHLALVLLQNGSAAPSHIAGTDNFYAITRYNQSSYYAMAVIKLGEAVEREAARQNASNP